MNARAEIVLHTSIRWVHMALAILALGSAFPLTAQTEPFKKLHDFLSGSDGAQPQAGLIQGLDGNLYGTTLGTIFSTSVSGTLTNLHVFTGSEGGELDGSLVQGANGNLYGTTYFGGADNAGTIFKLASDGTLTTLHNFHVTDGFGPASGLVRAGDGNLYGTTYFGGAFNEGTVFRITPEGVLTTLHSFIGGDPVSGLVQGTDGILCGTTTRMGCTVTDGNTVYKITTSGQFATIYTFNCLGGESLSALVQATDGNFYGTASESGENGAGSVFRITPDGILTTVYSFCSLSNCVDGNGPYDGLIQANDGNLYGVTGLGGVSTTCTGGCGTAFRLGLDGNLTTLYSFCSRSTQCLDGQYPSARLLEATDGMLFGVTLFGGTLGEGIIYGLSLGLPAFIRTHPTFAPLGAPVVITGTDLSSATGVTFSGTPASFTIVSPTEIMTAVPDGANSGPVEVTSANGSLRSNSPFRVTP